MLTKTIVPGTTHSGTERVFGFSIKEDAGATAKIELKSGSDSGQIVVWINFAADETKTIVLPKAVFWEFPGGCYVKEVNGSITGALHH